MDLVHTSHHGPQGPRDSWTSSTIHSLKLWVLRMSNYIIKRHKFIHGDYTLHRAPSSSTNIYVIPDVPCVSTPVTSIRRTSSRTSTWSQSSEETVETVKRGPEGTDDGQRQPRPGKETRRQGVTSGTTTEVSQCVTHTGVDRSQVRPVSWLVHETLQAGRSGLGSHPSSSGTSPP